jgi:hypothetical protein
MSVSSSASGTSPSVTSAAASPAFVAHPAESDPAVRWTLRAESIAAFVAGVAIYASAGGSLLFFIPLLLAPDLSMVGYLVNPRVGAATYNAVHGYAPGIILALLGWWLPAALLLMAGGVLIAHIGMDRASGYGLKYPTAFGDTHLGPIGRRRRV